MLQYPNTKSRGRQVDKTVTYTADNLPEGMTMTKDGVLYGSPSDQIIMTYNDIGASAAAHTAAGLSASIDNNIWSSMNVQTKSDTERANEAMIDTADLLSLEAAIKNIMKNPRLRHNLIDDDGQGTQTQKLLGKIQGSIQFARYEIEEDLESAQSE